MAVSLEMPLPAAGGTMTRSFAGSPNWLFIVTFVSEGLQSTYYVSSDEKTMAFTVSQAHIQLRVWRLPERLEVRRTGFK